MPEPPCDIDSGQQQVMLPSKNTEPNKAKQANAEYTEVFFVSEGSSIEDLQDNKSQNYEPEEGLYAS